MGVVTLMLITSEVNANKGGEPPFNMDNSHDFRPGCPIPNCDANFIKDLRTMILKPTMKEGINNNKVNSRKFVF